MYKFFLKDIFLLAFSLMALLDLAHASEDSYSVVLTKKGKVRGFKEKSLEGKKEFYSFLGIPYAKPPVGPLRFKAPIESEPWEDVLDALEYEDVCLQSPSKNIRGSEDCLYLNVFTHNPNSEPKPVMIFIHGGSLVSGEASYYRPYVLMDQDIVLVVIQYRLNIFGFLSTDDAVMPGNYGLKDQHLAIKWTKENIEYFGGDPERITIFGNSVGASSVHLHMLSPWSNGLFQRVISQSGTALCSWAVRINHRILATAFGDLVGCPYEGDSSQYFKCIRYLDEEKLIKASLGLREWTANPFVFGARIDGDFLPDHPARLIMEQKYNEVDFMSGINRDDGSMINYMLFSKDDSYEFLEDNFSTVGQFSLGFQDEPQGHEIANKLYQRYLKGEDISYDSNIQLAKLYTESFFGQCFDMATLLHSRDPDHHVYRYEFHHKGKFSYGDQFSLPETTDWITHMDELFYLFEGGSLYSRKMDDFRDLRIRRIMREMWTNFAATGNPTPDDSLGFTWDPARTSSFKFLNITTTPTNELDWRTSEREFWLSLPLEQSQYLLSVASKHMKEKEEL